MQSHARSPGQPFPAGITEAVYGTEQRSFSTAADAQSGAAAVFM